MEAKTPFGFKEMRWNCFVSVGRPGATIDRCIQSLNLDSHEVMTSAGIARSSDLCENAGAFLRSSHGRTEAPLLLICAYDDAQIADAGKCVDYFHAHLKPKNPSAGLVVFSSRAERQIGEHFHQHVPSQTLNEFERKVARHLQLLLEKQPAGSPLLPVRGEFSALAIEAEGASKVQLLLDQPFTLRVMVNGVPYEMYCHLRSNSDRLVVLGQDAITRDKVKLPHFFRWSWLDSIDASCIVLNDPTLYLGDDLNGGWFVGTPERDYVHECAEVIRVIAEQIGARAPTFYGVSAGGFSSLAFASCIEGAKAIVEIAQVDLTTYEKKREVEKLVRAAFKVDSVEAIPKALMHRVRIADRFKRERRIPEVLYQQNIRDRAHLLQFNSFLANWSEIAHMLPQSSVGKLHISTYDRWSISKGGHFPLPKDEAIKRLTAFALS